MQTAVAEKEEIGSLDLLIFVSGSRKYAINVTKVKEIVEYSPLTPIPKSHPYVEGMFMPRGELIPVLDMRCVLQHGESERQGNIIITGFSEQTVAFHVDSIEGIFSTSWKDIMEPSKALGDSEVAQTTGIVRRNKDLILILDFEKILSDVNPEQELRLHDEEKYADRKRIDIPILVVEDSSLLNKLIVESLGKAGYTNITHAMNGQEAWDAIRIWREEGALERHIQCLITDIEMPEMDGHSLIKHIKEDISAQDIKTVIFSSIINDVERKKGDKLGADVQLAKPEIDSLVEKLDELMGINEGI